MISFRKCVAIAFLIISGLFFLHASHSSASPVVINTEVDAEVESHHQRSEEQAPVAAKLEPEPPKTFRERLKYSFPYGATPKFPGYIWQTWKYTPANGKFDPTLRPLEASWTEYHPGFVHQVIDDDSALYFLRYLYASFPEIIEAYNAMPLPVLKADFFRYLILYARGGIYSDIDTFVIRPATEWIPSYFDRSRIGLVVGIEADPDRVDWAKWYSRRIQFCQWTIQAKPGHPILRDVIATITEETMRMKGDGLLTKEKMDRSIVEFTGPALWTDAIFRYFNDPQYFPSEDGKLRNISSNHFTGMTKQKQMGDVVVLPITSFSPGVQQMGSEEVDSEMAFVQHQFSGSWKSTEDRRIGHW
ncbi:hypothetical protein FQN49_000727 [Arthroderma sp. PD_2]|nr:hypothetical protein FQN49_000727 [Arthroderma sp. PD_2]